MVEPLDALLQRFPENEPLIERLYVDDPAFQEICTDFLELHRLVTRLQESPAESAQRMLIDYQAALIELETEVQIVLERAG